MVPADQEYLTTDQLSRYIHKTQGAVRNLVLRRAIPYRKPGGRLLFIRREIDEWVQMSEGITIDELKNG